MTDAEFQQSVSAELRETISAGKRDYMAEATAQLRKEAWQNVCQAVAEYGRETVIGWAECAEEYDGEGADAAKAIAAENHHNDQKRR